MLISLILVANVCFAQEKGSSNNKQDDAVKYTLRSFFPVNVQHVYELTDTTKISRKFSDSTSKDYTRIVKLYFSVWAPSAPDKEKFQEVSVSVDSLEYRMITSEGEIFFHSQADDLRLPKIDDYLNYMVPLGLEFDFVYSPYQEAGKIQGSIYNSKLKMLSDSLTKPSDSIQLFTWYERLSKTSLSTYFDIVKGFYPNKRIAVDSNWTKNIVYDIEGATINDSVQFTLKSFNIKSFIINGSTMTSKSDANDRAVLTSIRNITDVGNVKGGSDYYIRLQAKGILEELRINSLFEIEYNLKNDQIIQQVDTKRNWKLLGMYKI